MIPKYPLTCHGFECTEPTPMLFDFFGRLLCLHCWDCTYQAAEHYGEPLPSAKYIV